MGIWFENNHKISEIAYKRSPIFIVHETMKLHQRICTKTTDFQKDYFVLVFVDQLSIILTYFAHSTSYQSLPSSLGGRQVTHLVGRCKPLRVIRIRERSELSLSKTRFLVWCDGTLKSTILFWIHLFREKNFQTEVLIYVDRLDFLLCSSYIRLANLNKTVKTYYRCGQKTISNEEALCKGYQVLF